MAASTWFHGSAWPPGNHGIMPLGSCHDGDGLGRLGDLGGADDAVDGGDLDHAAAVPAPAGTRPDRLTGLVA